MAAPLLHDVEEPTRPRLSLRPYQRAAIDAAYTWHGTNTGNCLLVVPTGGGKSLIMGTIAKEAVDGGARVLVIAHRKELIEQNWKALQHAGLRALDCGLISGQHGRKDRNTPATVGSIQTLVRNPYTYGPFDLLLIDEAHLVPKADDTSYRKFLDAMRTKNPEVRCIGLTATPYRLDSGRLDQGDGRVFHEIAYEISIQTLLDGGFLAPLISKATLARYDVTGVAMRGGEYVESALQSAVDDPETTKAVVAELAQLGASRAKWLVFCAGVQHAEHMAEALTAAGFPAAAVHGGLSASERTERLLALRSGRLRALTNCDVLTTGYDEPSIDLLALCRPTASTGLHVQMLGRGFRTAPGKTDCLVLDFAGNCLTHGPVDALRIRDPKQKRPGDAPAKTCPSCQEIVGTATRLCPRCQFAFPPPAPAQLAPTALMAPVMSREKVPAKWYDVTSVEYTRHTPRDPKKRDTFRVDYKYHFQRIGTEWICIEHDGFAQEKARTWWADHLGGPFPSSIDEALDRAEALEKPVAVALEPDGQYDRVVNRRFADTAPMTRTAPPKTSGPCFFCAKWDDLEKTCTQWGQTPPDDIRLVGCEAYTESDDDPLPF
jgi:DNA repair protein RadD